MVPMAPSSTRMRWRSRSVKSDRVFLLGICLTACSDVFPLPVGERARVRGFMTRSSDDRLDNTVDIYQHVIIPKTQNQIAKCLKISGPLRVIRATLTVLTTIELDDQPRGLTAEIDGVRFDRHLPTKLHSV